MVKSLKNAVKKNPLYINIYIKQEEKTKDKRRVTMLLIFMLNKINIKIKSL